MVPVAIAGGFWLSDVRPMTGWLAAGSALALAGEGVRLWAAGHLVKRSALTASGPFAHTRHPLYWGSALIAVGLCVASRMWWTYALVALIFAVFYVPTALYEETWMRRRYGKAYRRYCEAVPRIGVRLRPYRDTEVARCANPDGDFRWRRIPRNREQQTAAGTLLVLAAMWAKLIVVGGVL